MFALTPCADTLIVIERPRWLCLWRIACRSTFSRDAARPDLPAGCPEQFDWKLMRDAWRYNVDRRPRIESERMKFGAQIPVVRLSSDREIDEFINGKSPAA
jgi:adenylate kinase family enzyme